MSYKRIIRDGLDYKNLDLKLIDFIEDFPSKYNTQQRAMFNRHNIALKKFWKTPSTQLLDAFEAPDGPVPDITLWSYGCLLLSPRATRFLNETLKDYGELLPVEIGEEVWNLYNSLTFYPEESVEVTSYPSGPNEGLIQTIYFQPQAEFDAPLFKASATIGRDLYCGHKFRSAVETYRLKGITFTRNLVDTF